MSIREKDAKRNIVVAMLSSVITIVCGIVVPRFLLLAFGSELNGAASSITTFLGYIALFDGGVSFVARAALYKPLAENDMDTVSAVVSEIRRFFRGIGLGSIVYVLVLACSFKTISHSDVLDWASSFLLVIVISITTFAQYFLGATNTVLIVADGKNYVGEIVSVSTVLGNALCTVLLIRLGCSFFVVKLFSSLIFTLKPVCLWLYIKKHYPLKKKRSGVTYLQEKWVGLGQHIAFFLHENADVVILTVFGDLFSVAVYSVYYLVVRSVKSVSSSFSIGMEAVFGNMYAKGEKRQLLETFDMYETLISIMSVILFGVTMVLIVPFIRLYTSGVNDTNYIEPVFGVLLALASLLSCLRIPYQNIIIAAGHFRQTNVASYGEAIINIVSSIVLVIRFGLVGVAIGTVAATLFRFLFYVWYLSRNILNRQVSCYAKRALLNVVTLTLIYLLGSVILQQFSLDNYWKLAMAGAAVGLMACAVCFLLNFIFFRDDCCRILKKLLTR